MTSAPTAPHRHPAQRALLLLLALTLIPALLLAWQRVTYEQAQKNAALILDYPALVQQANTLGLDPLELLGRYRQHGVNGVAIYETTVQTGVQRGRIEFEEGSELKLRYPDAPIKPEGYYTRDITPGANATLTARFNIPTRTLRVADQTWTYWPADPRFLPAGPDADLVARLKAAGYVIAYRPYDSPTVKTPGADWPDVPYIIFNGTKVLGYDADPTLKAIDARLGQRLPALIESGDGSQQAGITTLIEHRPGIRTFSIRPEWQDLLQPAEVADKFVLAARERSHRLLYARPFSTVDGTITFLDDTVRGLRKAGVTIGKPVIGEFQPTPTLRWLALLGPLVALALYALSVPLTRLGALAALGVLGLALATNGTHPLAAGALIAAVTFPVLGFSLRRERPTDWLLATAFSVLGVLFVSALGADRLSTLGLEPFRGVGLTLVVPLALLALTFLPKQDLRKTATDLYNTPMRLGDLAILIAGLAVIALVVLRRGNTPAVGVSATEAKVRAALQEQIIRPRFKELAGHPLAILGLSRLFPPYMNSLLLLGGVVGQASILNTFSHFHTPLLISGSRMVNGVLFGGVLGFILIPLVAWAIRTFRAYRAPEGRTA